MERANAWKDYDKHSHSKVFNLAEEYKEFLSEGKTERECVKLSIAAAKEKGFENLEDKINSGTPLKNGDRVYSVFMDKAIILAIIGREPLEKGMNILGAHIDSPRMDLKQNPVFEDTDMALLDTHYYGGIKNYQWVTLPLAMHGVVVKKDGSKIEINIGENETDPVFCVSDILVHLAGDQMTKKAKEAVEGEKLDVLFGSMPAVGEEKDAVKAHVLTILRDEYGIEEEDFLSAEIEIVPAGAARDCGIDRSMVIGYGQDDRVCAYTSLIAALDTKNLERTGICILVDKEEIGSVGATGMHSKFFENTVAEIMNLTGEYSSLTIRRALANSHMLSSDVSAAYDPNYPSAFEKKNAAYFGRGLVFNKYTGSRGKGGSNDANPEYMAKLRRIMDENEIKFQTAELGKVDQGGGGTIAYIPAEYGMNVIDSGVAVLSMHSPWEVTSKADIYEAYKGYVAFLKDMK